MALAPQNIATSAAQVNDSTALAQALQKLLDSGASVDDLLKTAAAQGVSLDPDLTKRMVDYVASGQKGASFLPGVLPGQEPTAAIAPAPSPADTTPLGAAIAGAADVFAAEPSLGLDPENRTALENLGVLGRYLYAPLGDVGAAAYTTAQAGLMGAARGTGQLLENIGVLPAVEALTSVKQTPETFAEQALGIADFAAMSNPFATIPQLPARAAPALPRIADVATDVTPPPVPRVRAPKAEPVVAVNELPTMTPAEGKAALGSMEQQGLTQPLPKLDVSANISSFAADYLNAANLVRPANMPFSEFFIRHLKAQTVAPEQLAELTAKYNIRDEDLMELATGTRQGLGEAARLMQAAQVVAKSVPREAAELAKLGVEQAGDLSLWNRITNVYRGALVSNMATTMRNNISSLARVPIDAVTNLTDTAINAAANPFRAEKVGVNPMDAFAVITDRFNPAQNKKFYDQIRLLKPGVNTELMATYAADVARVTKKDVFSKAEKAVDTINLFNRVSETATRKAMFPVFLRREATRLGYDFDELVNAERLNELPNEAYEKALNSTLDYTYSARPKPNSFADLFVRTVEKGGLPLATVMPFPRFMVNAMKFQFDHSPAGFYTVARDLISKEGRDKIAKGDVSALSKAMVGSSLLYAAYQFRNSENAGEKWYEAKTDSGKTFDLRPFFPAAPYLLVADAIKRAQDGSIDLAFAAKDFLQGLTGAQFRAGTGLYVADELIKDLGNASTNAEKAKTVLKQWLANLGSGFLVPFQQFKDFYAQYNPEEAVYRDAKDSAVGTLVRTLPGAQRALGVPEAELPTREGPSTTEEPWLRQLLGVTIKSQKNFLESEIDRLGLAPYELGPKTGDPEMDRLINRDLGIIAERGVLPLLESEQYKQLDDVRKVQAIRDVYSKAREVAVKKFEVENPELALIKSLKRRNRTEKVLINRAFEQRTGQTAESFLRQLRTAPLVRTQEQYDALPPGAKFTDPGDYKVYEKK